jgi:hypothetical protein
VLTQFSDVFQVLVADINIGYEEIVNIQVTMTNMMRLLFDSGASLLYCHMMFFGVSIGSCLQWHTG